MDVDGSSDRNEIPAAFGGMKVRVEFRPDSEDFSAYCALLFGDSTVVAALSQDSTEDGEALTAHAQTSERFYAGEERSIDFPEQVSGNSATHFAYIGTAGKLILTLG